MKVFDQKHIKNIVLLGAPKSGKTSLTETMLYEAGIINRRGTVEEKNTVSDYHEIEHERGNSVYATCVHTEWKDYKINVIDTPGLDDFIGEIVSSIRVADTAVMLLNAQHGVEVASQLIWNYVDTFKKPTILAINQVDHEKADFFKAYESAKSSFGEAAVLMQYPVNQGEGFNAIIDLLKMTMYKFPKDGGKPEKLPIPEAELERANQLHNDLVEKAAVNDDTLMEHFFENGSLDEDEMRNGLRIGMINHDIFPVFCLSAKNDMGSGRLMGFIDNVAPAYVDTEGEMTTEGELVAPDASKPASAFVFKTLVEPFLGKVTFFKVLSGTIKVGDDLMNATSDTKERINQLYIMDGRNKNTVDQLVTGDIGATVKLKNTHTNDTLHVIGKPVVFEKMNFPSPKVRVAITADGKQEEEALAENLRHMHEEDPTLELKYFKELRQLILSGQGELHLALAKWRLENLHNLHVAFGDPKIPYRETIQQSATVNYRHKKQSGGAGQFAEVTLTIMPYEENMADPEGFTIRNKEVIDLEWGGKLVFYNCIVGGVIDARFIPSVIKGVMEVLEDGPITRSYVRDVVVLLHDGKMHSVDSNDISFKIAGAHAFKDAFMQSRPLILEPQYQLEVFAPEDVVGEVMTDLQTRRAIVNGIDNKDNFQVIKARIPLAELDHYATALKSISQGRANFFADFAEYSPLPYEMQEKLIHNSTETIEA
jgi:elongation factor G